MDEAGVHGIDVDMAHKCSLGDGDCKQEGDQDAARAGGQRAAPGVHLDLEHEFDMDAEQCAEARALSKVCARVCMGGRVCVVGRGWEEDGKVGAGGARLAAGCEASTAGRWGPGGRQMASRGHR